LDIGIVTAIAAPATLMVDFSGGGGHAGALLMKHRCAEVCCGVLRCAAVCD
ncbi:unnamed protein product, partial [Closterium sp. NIES-53]